MKSAKILSAIMLGALLTGTSCVSKKKYKKLDTSYHHLDSMYNSLMSQYNGLNKSSKDYQQLSQSELQQLNTELQQKLKDLEASNRQVADLQAAMQRARQSQQELLSKITNALIGFNASDLTAELRKDGKVYVSLSEKLLFKSGSYDVDPKGKEALQKLGEVLSKQPDLDITVEGHTDSIPLKKGMYVKDNLDLSVMRATTIVRLLSEQYGVNPKQLYASGRGENFPIAPNSTPEGRAKNRRTEIIISPKISELLKLVENR